MQSTKAYFEARDAQAKNVVDEVQQIIEEKGLSYFIGMYIDAVKDAKNWVFDIDELFCFRPGEELSEELVALRKQLVEEQLEFRVELLRKHGAKVPVAMWARTFGFLCISNDIKQPVLDKMNISATFEKIN